MLAAGLVRFLSEVRYRRRARRRRHPGPPSAGTCRASRCRCSRRARPAGRLEDTGSWSPTSPACSRAHQRLGVLSCSPSAVPGLVPPAVADAARAALRSSGRPRWPPRPWAWRLPVQVPRGHLVRGPRGPRRAVPRLLRRPLLRGPDRRARVHRPRGDDLRQLAARRARRWAAACSATPTRCGCAPDSGPCSPCCCSWRSCWPASRSASACAGRSPQAGVALAFAAGAVGAWLLDALPAGSSP